MDRPANARIGQGKTVHRGSISEGAGTEAWFSLCGADHATNRGMRSYRLTNAEVSCKKCQKALAKSEPDTEKLTSLGDDGKYYCEGEAQFSIEAMSDKNTVTEARWCDEEDALLSPRELATLSRYYYDDLLDEWNARFRFKQGR